jgi:putative PIN family toxin of toxin-antitoxin system
LVIDAGVLVAATVVDPDAPTALLIEAAKRGTVEMVVCDQLMDDVRRALRSHLLRDRLDGEESEQFMDVLAHVGRRMHDPVLPPRIVSDPGDDYIVALANASNADAVVTGDRDLLNHPDLFPPAVNPREAASVFDLGWYRPSLSANARPDRDGSEHSDGQRQAEANDSARPTKVSRDKPKEQDRARGSDAHGLSIRPLYAPLSGRGMDREAVARNQRARLYGGMIETVSQRGYHATTVARVLGLAGVSRRTFYEQFSDKEECFLATYDIVIARARKVMLEAWKGERGWANRLHAACKALLHDVAESPKGSRLVLVDSLGIGPKARERMQLAGFTFERLVATAFQASPDGVGFPQLTSRGIVGGVRHVLFMRMLENRERELYALPDEVLDWIESYRTPAVAGLRTIAVAPRVPPTPAAFLAREDRRARVLSSVVHLTLDEGYARLTDPQIAQFAGISTEAFHKQFVNKEECFLAVLDEFAQEVVDAMRPNIEIADSWPQAVCQTMAAFVDHLVAHQALLRIAFIDLFEVGPGMVSRMTKLVEGVIKLLIDSGPVPRSGPRIANEAVTGALWAIISSYVANDRISRLPALVDHMAFVLLAPYVGPAQAVAAIQHKA